MEETHELAIIKIFTISLKFVVVIRHIIIYLKQLAVLFNGLINFWPSSSVKIIINFPWILLLHFYVFTNGLLVQIWLYHTNFYIVYQTIFSYAYGLTKAGLTKLICISMILLGTRTRINIFLLSMCPSTWSFRAIWLAITVLFILFCLLPYHLSVLTIIFYIFIFLLIFKIGLATLAIH